MKALTQEVTAAAAGTVAGTAVATQMAPVVLSVGLAAVESQIAVTALGMEVVLPFVARSAAAAVVTVNPIILGAAVGLTVYSLVKWFNR
jgi:hypothetical protein